jgi:hypothetical protein
MKHAGTGMENQENGIVRDVGALYCTLSTKAQLYFARVHKQKKTENVTSVSF